MDKIKYFFKNNIITFIGMLSGALLGYIYWATIGCETGTCPITASPVRSSLYGAVLGGLIVNLFTNKKNNDKK